MHYISGCGTSSVFCLSAIFVGYYFEKRRAFAMSLTSVGSGLGTILFAPFYRILIHHYSWRGAMILTAGVTLNHAIFGSIFIPKPPKHIITNSKHSMSVIPDTSIIRDIRLYIVSANFVLWGLGSTLYFIFAVDFIVQNGLTRDQASFVVAIAAIGNLLIRICISITFIYFTRLKAIYLFGVFCGLCGLAVAVTPFVSSNTGIFVTCCAAYTAYGGISGTQGLATVQTFGLDKATKAYGILLFMAGVGSAVGPPVAGRRTILPYLYRTHFYTCVLCYTLSKFSIPIIIILKRKLSCIKTLISIIKLSNNT